MQKVIFLGFAPNVTNGYFVMRVVDSGIQLAAEIADETIFPERDVIPERPAMKDSDENKFDLLILMDVIEHVDDPIALIESYKDFLKPGAHILITVPAFQSLWSQHDVLLDHKKRYTREILNDETKKCGLTPKKESYIFSVFFPVVYLVRKLLKGNNSKAETDLKLPHPLINILCFIIGVLERRTGNLLPFGTSVFGIYELDK